MKYSDVEKKINESLQGMGFNDLLSLSLLIGKEDRVSFADLLKEIVSYPDDVRGQIVHSIYNRVKTGDFKKTIAGFSHPKD